MTLYEILLYNHGADEDYLFWSITPLQLANSTNCLDLIKLLTPYSRVLNEQLIKPQLIKKFPAFNGPQRFIIVFTSTHHRTTFFLNVNYPFQVDIV